MSGNQNALKIIETMMRSTGNTWMPKPSVEEYFTEHGINLNLLRTLQEEERLIACRNSNGDILYTIPYFSDYEDSIAVNAIRLLVTKSIDYLMSSSIDKYIDEAECFYKSKLDIHQRDAVKMVCLNNLSVLTGGPGTGKTFGATCS